MLADALSHPGTAGPHPACTLHRHTCNLDHVAPTCHTVALQSGPRRTYTLHSCSFDPNHIQLVHGTFATTIQINSHLYVAPSHSQSGPRPTYTPHCCICNPDRLPTYLMHRPTDIRDDVPEMRSTVTPAAPAQVPPTPPYRPTCHLPLPLSQHLLAAPSTISEQPAELRAGVRRGGVWGGLPSLATNPVSPAGPWGEDAQPGCNPGKGEDPTQLLPTQRTPFPRSPPAGLGLTAAASVRAGGGVKGRRGGWGEAGQARRGAAGSDPPPAPAAAGLCPPAGAAPGSGAERGRCGGAGRWGVCVLGGWMSGTDRLRQGSFSPPGEGSCRAAPAPAPCRGYPRRQPRSPPAGSSGQSLAGGRDLPGDKMLRPLRPPPRPGKGPPSSCRPWASWRQAMAPALARGVLQPELLIAPAWGPSLSREGT